ncbi:MAG: hypothetical protein ACR2LR_05220 [Hassallia sp.]
MTTSAVLLSTFIMEGKIAQALPRPVALLRAKCVSSGLGTSREQNVDVSIGKAVYTSQFYLGAGNRSASLTCKIKPDNRPESAFQTFNLGFGIPDNDPTTPNVVVKVYLDGQQAESRTVIATQPISLSLDVSNVSNVAIEAVCSRSNEYCGRVYFYKADLERKIVSPQPKK